LRRVARGRHSQSRRRIARRPARRRGSRPRHGRSSREGATGGGRDEAEQGEHDPRDGQVVFTPPQRPREMHDREERNGDDQEDASRVVVLRSAWPEEEGQDEDDEHQEPEVESASERAGYAMHSHGSISVMHERSLPCSSLGMVLTLRASYADVVVDRTSKEISRDATSGPGAAARSCRTEGTHRVRTAGETAYGSTDVGVHSDSACGGSSPATARRKGLFS
jgi:hypothetical protein